jgi:hypothetical protein
MYFETLAVYGPQDDGTDDIECKSWDNLKFDLEGILLRFVENSLHPLQYPRSSFIHAISFGFK